VSIPSGDGNPFAPPKAAVLEAESPDGELVLEGQKVATSRGVEWFGEGWRLFKASPGVWVGMFAVFTVLSLFLGFMPMGSIVVNLLYPVLVAGVMLGCRSLDGGGELRFKMLFEGFNKNAGSLMLVGVLYMVGWFIVSVVVFGVGMAFLIPMVMSGGFKDLDANAMLALAPWLVVIALVAIAFMLPLIMALWFAPALVVLHDVQPMAAMRASFTGCLKNMMPFLLYGVVALLLSLVAVIPAGLGFLVVGPVMWGTMYAGYRDIYVRPA
jgi:uncharacterized membrane protein